MGSRENKTRWVEEIEEEEEKGRKKFFERRVR